MSFIFFNCHQLSNLISNYPIDCCAFITSKVFEIIQNTPEICREIPTQHCRRVHIILGLDTPKPYFQHALQVGNYLVDPAADAGGGSNKVKITPIQDAHFSNINNFDQALAIAKNYWNFTFYPNLYFPRAAPALPFFGVREGEIRPKFFSDLFASFFARLGKWFFGSAKLYFFKFYF